MISIARFAWLAILPVTAGCTEIGDIASGEASEGRSYDGAAFGWEDGELVMPGAWPVRVDDAGTIVLPAAALRTIAIGREGSAVAAGVAIDLVSDPEGDRVAIDHGSVVEEIAPRASGIEQRWLFESLPAGTGALSVRVEVEGALGSTTTERGITFASDAGPFRYGHGTWIDARGVRTSIRSEVSVEDGRAHIDLSVPAEVLAASSYPAVLDPEVSPEIEIDAPVQGFAAGDQVEPAVGALGAGHFAVWTDARANSYSAFGETSIWGTRVSAGGEILDPGSILVADLSPEYVLTPRFAGGPSGGLAVFTRKPYGSSNTATFAKRVDAAGQPVGGAISIAPASSYDPVVAFDGTSYLVVWRASGTRAVRIDANGAKLDATDIEGVLPCATAADVAFGAGTYLVVGACGGQIRGRLVSPAGVLGASDFSVSPANGGSPRVAFDGTNFVVAYEIGNVEAVRVSPSGVALDVPIVVGTGAQDPSVASSGSGSSMITWRAADAVRGARLSGAGVVLDPAGLGLLPTAEGSETPAIAAAAGQYLVVRKRNDNDYSGLTYQGMFDVEGVRVATSGALLGSAFPVATAANGQVSPSAAFDGENHLVVWEDYRDGDWDIYGVRVAPDGTPIDSAAFPITNRPLRQAKPAVAFGAGHYLVAWTEGQNGDFYTQQVATDGTLTGTPIKVGLSGHPAEFSAADMALGASSTRFLLAFEDYEVATGIRGFLLGDSGGLVGTVPAIASDNHYNVAVTSDGTDFLVAFNGNSSNTYFTRVTGTGAVVQNTISVSEDGGSVAATFDGDNYLVTWGAGAVRVTPDGALLDLLPIEVGAGYIQASDASADGTGFVVVYRDDGKLYARRVGADGTAIGFPQYMSDMDPYYEEQPALSSDKAGRSLAAFARFDEAAPYGIRRIRARVLTSEDAPMGTGGEGGPPPGAGGEGGTGGASAAGGGGGTPNPSGGDAADDAEDEGGCGCEVAGATRGGGRGALLGLLAIVCWIRGRSGLARRLKRAALVGAMVAAAGCADGESDPHGSDDDDGGGGDGPAPCTEAALNCNGDITDGCEVDVSTHAQHCGACGLSCGGGTCVEGVCQPFVVGSVTSPNDHTVHDGAAYLVHGWDGYIEKFVLVPKGERSSFGVGEYPDKIAAAETSLVFSIDYEVPDMVMRSSFEGLAPTVVAWGTYDYADLAVAGDRAVWLDEETFSLQHAALDGTDEISVSIPAQADRLSTNATHVAYRENQTIALVDLASSFKAILADSPNLSHPALSAEHAYWVEDGSLQRWAFADGSFTTLAEGLGTIEEIAVSGRRIFLAPANGPMLSVDLADGGQRVASDVPASNIASDADGATWITNGLLYHQIDPDPERETRAVCDDELFADCNGETADGCETSLWSDRAHCGACGQVCDGPCAMGTCQATVVATDLEANTFTLLGDQIVFATYDKLAQIPKEGGAVTDIATTAGLGADSFLVEGSNLYLCLNDNIMRYTLGTPGLFPLASGYGPYGLGYANGTLFFGASDDVYRVSATGGTPTLLFDAYAANQDFVSAVTANGNDVFVATDSFNYSGGVFRVPATGGPGQAVITDPDGSEYAGFRHLLADASTLYAGHESLGLYVVPKTGGQQPAVWAGGEGVMAMAQDAERVYWVASKYIADPNGGYSTYRLVRATKGSTTVETIDDLAQGTGTIAVDDVHVYYQQGALLLRRPK